MPKYKNQSIGTIKLETESNNYDLNVSIDTLGIATIEFGASMSLRIDYNNIEKLTQLLDDAKMYLEDQAIDQAAPNISVPSDYIYKDPTKPENW